MTPPRHWDATSRAPAVPGWIAPPEPRAPTPPSKRTPLALLLLLPCLPAATAILPERVITHDDTVIDRSCLVVIAPDTILADTNNNGVLQIKANDIVIRFAPNSVLRGADPETPWDALRGLGIRLNGHRDVSIEQARVHGYFCGLVASHADGLVVDGGDFSDNYRQHLRSTPEAEDIADWLFPHRNDDRKWREEYGAAIVVESTQGAVVRNVRVRRGQNGILLDRVALAQIYDNDCSFLSGWGLALWRSSSNTIAHNAFDFCVRGHVEGVYNRGQDSAGILCFEQSNDNLIAENSATHGGDGFFGFAGREALGEVWRDRELARLRADTGRTDVEDLIQPTADDLATFRDRGCNRNRLIANDFSYAAAHGIELTFSEDNRILDNRVVENAICGVWGGYSSRTLIGRNHFEGNGGMAYGLERGAINMEHASDNLILENTFHNNRCAIHLWWDDDRALHRLPGVQSNLRGVSRNVIARNALVMDRAHPFGPLAPSAPLLLLHLRDTGTNHLQSNAWLANTVRLDIVEARTWDIPPGTTLLTQGQGPALPPAETLNLPGTTRPVGARPQLRGRRQILLDDWGPWDHESPLVRRRTSPSGDPRWEFFGLPSDLEVVEPGDPVTAIVQPATPLEPVVLSLTAPAGVHRYTVRVRAGDFTRTLRGTLVQAQWKVTFFPWTIDPRQDLAAWRRLAQQPAAVTCEVPRLNFPYGWGGPKDLQLGTPPDSRLPSTDRFGMIARARLPLTAGRWRITTLSDDGVRVLVDGRPVLENWAWHGPTKDTADFEQPRDGTVELRVEHFEIDGYAVLAVELEPVPTRPVPGD